VPLAACDQYFNCGSTVQFDILTFAPGTKIWLPVLTQSGMITNTGNWQEITA
jgi:hypothetical protein